MKHNRFRNEGEQKAMAFLETLGHRLLYSNYLTPDRRTEIDLITVQQECLHFVEVKAWKPGGLHPLESQSPYRRHRVYAAARMFLGQHMHELIKELCPARRHSTLAGAICFDLVWVQPGHCEFFERIF